MKNRENSLFSLAVQAKQLKKLDEKKPAPEATRKKTDIKEATKKVQTAKPAKPKVISIGNVFIKGQVNKDTVVMTQGSQNSIVLGEIFPDCFTETGELVEVIQEKKTKKDKEEKKEEITEQVSLDLLDEVTEENENIETVKSEKGKSEEKAKEKSKSEEEKITKKIKLTPDMVRKELANTTPQFVSKEMTQFSVDIKKNILFALISAGKKGCGK